MSDFRVQQEPSLSEPPPFDELLQDSEVSLIVNEEEEEEESGAAEDEDLFGSFEIKLGAKIIKIYYPKRWGCLWATLIAIIFVLIIVLLWV